jgi:hypothetical protein
MAYIFEQIAKTTKTAINNVTTTLSVISKKLVADARKWFFSETIPSVAKSIQVNEAVNPLFKKVGLPSNPIGKMYCFVYDPKYKDTLPYYDKFPLIFPIEIYNDGFLGINLHYLTPMLRAKLMNALYETLNNNKYDDTTRLRISYQILKSSSRFKLFEPCIKRYLFTHVRSSYLNVPVEHWDKVIMLPLERFVYNNKKTKKTRGP